MSFSAANLRWHVLGPRSGGTTGAALGQGLGFSCWHGECDRAEGPAPGLGSNQLLAALSSSQVAPVGYFGVLADWNYTFPNSPHFPAPDARV